MGCGAIEIGWCTVEAAIGCRAFVVLGNDGAQTSKRMDPDEVMKVVNGSAGRER